MKKTLKLLTILLMVGLIFGLSACKKEEEIPEVTEVNVLSGWTDGGDGVYTITTNTEVELAFSYAKATFPYAFMRSADITEDLSVFKKLVITVEGTGTILVKLETTDSTPAKEVGLNVTGIQGTYEWNLMNDSAFLAKVDKIVIIAAPGKETSIGDIQITSMMFEKTVADGYIIQDGFTNIPTNVNEYNGTDVEFDFNAKWENFAEETYTISYSGSTTVVSFDKAAGQEWSTMQSRVQGDFTDFNYVVAIVSGTVGQKFLLKAANGYEGFVFLTAEQQEVVVDISAMTAAEKNAITSIFAFGLAGVAGTGNFVIHEAFMAATYDYEPPVIIKNIYDGVDTEFAVGNWYDGGDMNYEFAVVEDDVTVTYDKTADWANMVAHLEGDFSSFTKLEFQVTGTLNKTALFKVEGPSGNIELPVTFDGTRQTVFIDLTTLPLSTLETLNKVVIFAAPGGSGAGTFTIHSTTFMTGDFSLQDTWAEQDAGTYVFSTTVDNTVLVTYTKVAQGWVYMKSVFTEEEVTGLNTLEITLKGTDAKQVLVKANGVEQWVTFAGTDPVTVTYTADLFTEIIMFAEGGVDNATGTFEIVSANLSYVAPDLDPTLVVDVNSNWIENDAGTYAFTNVGDTVQVDYTKGVGQEWSFMKQTFDATETAGLNTLTLVLQGTADKQVLVKPNDSGALEQTVIFGAEPITVVVYADSFTNLIMFAEANVAEVSGSFVIISATLSYTYMIEGWAANVDTIYDISVVDGAVEVDYDKLAGNEWEWMRVVFNADDVVTFNTLVMTVQGTIGDTLLIKPNDNGALEQSVTFTDTDPVTITVTFDAFANIFIFAQPNVAPASGSFTILSATLSYVEADFDPTLVVDFNSDWFAGVDTIYDIAIVVGVVEVDYNKLAGNEWEWMKAIFDQDVMMGLNTLTITVQGTVGDTLLIKPNDDGALEQSVTFVDTDPVTLTFVSDSLLNVILFAQPGTAPAAGSFEILSSTLSYTYTLDEWLENDAGTYAFSTTLDDTILVTYTKVAQGWVFMKADFTTEQITGMNTLTITLSGTDTKQVLVKVNGVEQWVTFVGTDPITVTFTADLFTEIIMFAEGGVDDATGTFEIISAVATYVEPTA